jgi:hypothetical protein
MHSKTFAIATLIALFGAALPAASSEILVRSRCYRPQQGYGTCEVRSPDSEQDDNGIVSITWQNGGISRIQFPEDSKEMPLVWNSRENRWLSATTLGFCANEKCLYFPDPDWIPRNTGTASLTCLHPTLGENTCQVEIVPDTKGIRVYWPDNSIDHVNFSNVNEATIWSNAQNDWVGITNAGACLDRECVFLDLDFFASLGID